jgi:prefoldin subunit 5
MVIFNVVMTMKLNVINLKTLSLSVLMALSMISGAFAMEPEDIDNKRQIGSVKAARAMFSNGESPVKKEGQSSKVNFKEDFKNAEGEGAAFLKKKVSIKEEAEIQTQALQKKIEELTASIPAKKQELEAIQAESARIAQEIEEFKKNVWISKDSGIGRALTTAASYVWASKTSPAPQPVVENKVAEEETVSQTPKAISQDLSVQAGDEGAEAIFARELSITKEKAEAQLKGLEEQFDSLEADISSAKAALATQKAEHEKLIGTSKSVKDNALLTTEQLNAVKNTVSSVAPASYNPLSYFWKNKGKE